MTEPSSKGHVPKGDNREDSGNSGDKKDVQNTAKDQPGPPTPPQRRHRQRNNGSQGFTAGTQKSDVLGKGKQQGPSTTQNLTGGGCTDTKVDGPSNSFQGKSNSARPADSTFSGAGDYRKQSFGHGNETQSIQSVNPSRHTSTISGKQDAGFCNSNEIGHPKPGSSVSASPQMPNPTSVSEDPPPATAEKQTSIGDGDKSHSGTTLHDTKIKGNSSVDTALLEDTEANTCDKNPSPTEPTPGPGKSGSESEGKEDHNFHTGDSAPRGGMTSTNVPGKENLIQKNNKFSLLPDKFKHPGDPKKKDLGLQNQNLPGLSGLTAVGDAAKLDEEEIIHTQTNTGHQTPKTFVTQENIHQPPSQLSGACGGFQEENVEDDLEKDTNAVSSTQVHENTATEAETSGSQQPSVTAQQSAKELKQEIVEGESGNENADINDLCKRTQTLSLSQRNNNTLSPQPEQVEQSTIAFDNDLNDGTESEDNKKKPSSKCINKNDKHAVEQALDSASGKHDSDDSKPTDPEVQPPNRSGLASDANALAGSHLSTFENTYVAIETETVHTPEKIVNSLTEEAHNHTGSIKPSRTGNEENDEQKEKRTTQPGTVEIARQPGQAKDNISLTDMQIKNDFASGSEIISGQETNLRDCKTKTQVKDINQEKNAKNEQLFNGKYIIEKIKDRWCLRDISNKRLFPQRDIVANSVEFLGEELLVVDGEDYQLMINSNDEPILVKCFNNVQNASPLQTPHLKDLQSSNPPQNQVSKEHHKESTFEKPTAGDVHSNICGEHLQSAAAQRKKEDKPSKPLNLIVTEVMKDSIVLSWQPPASIGGTDISAYIIEKRDAKGNVWTKVNKVTGSTNTYAVQKLLEGNKYFFRVAAENDIGLGDSAELEAPIQAKCPFDVPDSPTHLQATEVTKSSVTLTWEVPQKDGGSPITGCVLEKCQSPGNCWVKVSKKPIADTMFIVADLSENVEYMFRVSAENAIGVGKPSEPTNPILAKAVYDDSQPPDVPSRGIKNTSQTSYQGSSTVILEEECVKKMVQTEIFMNAFKSKYPSSHLIFSQNTDRTSVTFQCTTDSLKDVLVWFEQETAIHTVEFSSIRKHKYVKQLDSVIERFMKDEYSEQGTVFWSFNEVKKSIHICTVGEPAANSIRSNLANALKKVTLKWENNTENMLSTLQAELQKTIKVCAVVFEAGEYVIIHVEKKKNEDFIMDLARQILNSVDKIITIHCKDEGIAGLEKLITEKQMNVKVAKIEDSKCIKWTFPGCQMVKLLVGQADFVAFAVPIHVINDDTSAKEGLYPTRNPYGCVLNIYKKSMSDKKKVHTCVESIFKEATTQKYEAICIGIPQSKRPMHELQYVLKSLWQNCIFAFEKQPTLKEVVLSCHDDQTYTCCTRIFSDSSNENIWCDNSQTEPLDISVATGALETTKADVLVNSIGVHLKFDGYVSNQLLKHAGQELQTAVSKHKKPINVGEFIVTKGFNIETCKFIFHGAVGRCESNSSEDVLLKNMHKLVTECILAADENQLASIAFPALGTGKAGFTSSKVASTMFQAIEDVQKKLEFVKNIMIVISQEQPEQLRVFQDAKNNWLNSNFWYRKSSTVLKSGNVFCRAVCAPPMNAPFDNFICISKEKKIQESEVFGDKKYDTVLTDGSAKRTIQAFVEAFKKAFTFNKHTVGIYVESKLMSVAMGTDFCNASAMAGTWSDKPLRVVLVFSEDKWCHDTFKQYEQDNIKVVSLAAKGSMKDVHATLENLKQIPGIEIQEMTASAREVAQTYSPSNQEEVNGTRPKINSTFAKSQNATEPKPLTMTRDHHQWHKDMLQAGVETKIAVVDGLQNGTTENELKAHFGSLLNAVKHQVVFNEETTKALLVFDNESDMQRVCNMRSENFPIKPHSRVAISNFRYAIAKHEVENDCIIQYFLGKKFQRPYFACEDINGNVIITSQTSYGVDYILSALKGYECRTYKGVTELKMKVFGCEKCRSQLFGTSYIDSEIFCEGDSFNLVCRSNALLKIDTCIQKILKFEGEKEFQLEKENLSKAEGWRRELERDGYTSIVLEEEGKFIVLFETYDDVKKVAAKFNALKGAKIKPTGRPRNRDGVTNTTPVTDHSQDYETYDGSGVSAGSDATWMVDAKDLVDYSRYLPIKVCVYRASICKLNVDCIVNAANGQLSHGAGVAYAIAKDAGDELTKEGDEYIQSNGSIKVGEVAVTKAGRLKYRCVIHAVGPRWSDYDTSTPKGVEQCGKDLYSAVMNSFTEANRRGMRSIALPAISSAIFGVPMKYCTMMYAKAVLDFCTLTKDRNQALDEIHFVDVNRDTVREIQAMFDCMIRDNQPEPFDANDMLSTNLNRSRRDRSTFESSVKQKPAIVSSTGNQPKNAIKPFVGGRTKQYNGDITLTLHSPELQTKIYCYKGDIFKAHVNALVVIIDNKCEAGRIGCELKKRMDLTTGQVYDAKLNAIAPLYPKTGSVIEVAGQWDKYNTILNVVLPLDVSNMSAHLRNELMKEMYKELFQKVCANSMTKSVAMTPLAVYKDSPEEIRLGTELFWNGFLNHCGCLKDVQPVNLDVHLVCKENYNVLKTIEVLEECNKALEKSYSEATTTGEKNKSQIFMEVSDAELKEDGNCVICMDKITQPKKLLCGHIFCAECIDQSLGFKQCCPTCGRVCGIIKGIQPAGKMIVTLDRYQHCYGYDKFGKICIKYNFFDGTQLDIHPSPGKPYRGITRNAYLPDNEQGRNVCRMLKVAFHRKLVFTIGHSHTTGQDDAITWNDIHHKTDYKRDTQFGYPDPTYLDRVTEELKAKSITIADIDPNSALEEVLESN